MFRKACRERTPPASGRLRPPFTPLAGGVGGVSPQPPISGGAEIPAVARFWAGEKSKNNLRARSDIRIGLGPKTAL